MDRIKEDDLAKGMLAPVVVQTYLKGDDTVEHILIPGGSHPKMRFVDDVAHCKSFSATIVFTTTDPVLTLYKGAGRIAVAATAGGSAAHGFKERWTRTAAAAGKQEDNVCVFEVEDDVVVQITSAGNAATFNLAQLHFERIE